MFASGASRWNDLRVNEAAERRQNLLSPLRGLLLPNSFQGLATLANGFRRSAAQTSNSDSLSRHPVVRVDSPFGASREGCGLCSFFAGSRGGVRHIFPRSPHSDFSREIRPR